MLRAVQSAVRGLRTAPVFAVSVTLTLSLGIGLTTATMSVVQGVAFPRLPYAVPERLVVVGSTTDRSLQVPTDWLTSAQLPLSRQPQPSSFAASTAFLHHDAIMPAVDGAASVRSSGAAVDVNFFSVLGVEPRLGRVVDETDRDGPAVIVLSEHYWESRFGGSRDAIGQTIALGGMRVTIIGVMPMKFNYPAGAQYWLHDSAHSFDDSGAYLLARLTESATPTSAATELRMRYAAAWMTDSMRFGGMWIAVEPFGQRERRIAGSTLLLVFAGVAALLLVALANLSTLILARCASRSEEFAIRAALGAAPWRAVAPFATELGVLVVAGSILGLAIAAGGTGVIRAASHEYAATPLPFSDPRTLAFTVVLTLATAALLAVQPLIKLSRVSAMDSMRRGGVSTDTLAERRTRNVLVAAQVACAFTFVMAAGIVGRSYANFQRLDVGYDVERLIVAIPEYDFDSWSDHRQRALAEAVVERGVTTPDIESVAYWRLRMSAWPPPPQDEAFGIEALEDRAIPPGYQLHSYYEVSDDFFRTMGVDVVAGRHFSVTDAAGAEPVAIIAESAARVWFEGQPAVGRRVRIGPPGSEWLRIVGVVPDLSFISGFGRTVATRRSGEYLPWLFRPMAQAGDVPPITWPRRRCLDCSQVAFGLRTSSAASGGSPAVRQLAGHFAELAPNLPVVPQPFLQQQMSGYTPSLLRRNRTILTSLAALTLALSLLGLFGVVTSTVVRRTREVAIRMAVGARPASVLRLVAMESVVTAAVGLTIGAMVVVTGRTVMSQVFFAGGHPSVLVGTSATDVGVAAPAAATILAVAAITAVVGAFRITRLNPAAALKQD